MSEPRRRPAIRAAREADADAIAAIYNQGIAEREATFETETRRGDDVRQWLAAGDALLVAEQERAVLGWARTYDAEYLALARLLDCRVVTVDARLLRGTRRLGFVVAPSDL